MGAGLTRSDRRARRRARVELIETGLLVALAALVLFKGAAAVGSIALATGAMMAELLRVLFPA